MQKGLLVLLLLSASVLARESGDRVTYVGGTVAGVRAKCEARLDVVNADGLVFTAKGASVRVPYQDINTIEYGMRVSRRYMEAVLISPVFLVAKRRTHFLTIGYSDGEGKQQAIVLQVNKEEIRPLLVSLEARTGKRVEFQDEDARRAGKG